MQTWTDAELLRDYAGNKSEAAFGEIVRRYSGLVYSAAIRQTGDAEQARDVAQMVFSDLARKAGSVGERTLLAGWLYKGVRLQALEQRRNDQRRARREKEAMESIDPCQEPVGDWAALRPVLDTAIAALSEDDRDALLLRFFKNESFASVGGALGVSEDTAQKRVARALEKMRTNLAQRGITTTSAALSATLAANAVETLPAGLMSSLAVGAMAGTTSGAIGRPSIFKLFSLVNSKSAVAILGLAGSLAVLTALYVQRSSQLDDLRAALQKTADESASLRAENERLSNRLADLVQHQSHSDDSRIHEMAQLRAKVARLRSDAELAKLGSSSQAPPAATNAQVPAAAQITIRTAFITVPANGPDVGGATGLLTWDQFESMNSSYKAQPEANSFAGPSVTTLCGRQAHVSSVRTVSTPQGSTNIGVSVDFIPECSADSDAISLVTLIQGTRLGEQLNVEELVFTNSINIASGNSLMMTRRLPGIGEWFEGDPTNSTSPRDLIVFITPTLVDPAGNPLFTSDTANSPVTAPLFANPSGVIPNTGPAAETDSPK